MMWPTPCEGDEIKVQQQAEHAGKVQAWLPQQGRKPAVAQWTGFGQAILDAGQVACMRVVGD
jgi:hypothetical protein